MGQLPILEVGTDNRLCQSSAIARYLANVFGNKNKNKFIPNGKSDKKFLQVSVVATVGTRLTRICSFRVLSIYTIIYGRL